MERWMRLTTDFKGVTYCPITYESVAMTRRASIPNIIAMAIEGITAGRRRAVMRLNNTGHPVNSELALARGTDSTYDDHGMTWDNTGRKRPLRQFPVDLALKNLPAYYPSGHVYFPLHDSAGQASVKNPGDV